MTKINTPENAAAKLRGWWQALTLRVKGRGVAAPTLPPPPANRDPMRPAIDRALDRDHRLCSIDPCSDCR